MLQTQQPSAINPGNKLPHDVLIDNILDFMSSPDEETRLKAGLALKSQAKLSDVPKLVKVLKRGNNSDMQNFLIQNASRASG